MMVPWTTVPFFNSTVTVSFASFMRNLEKREKKTKTEGKSEQKEVRKKVVGIQQSCMQ